MVERAHRAAVATFYAAGSWGASVELSEADAHHANVKRLEPGDVVRLTNGEGRRATGVLSTLAKHRASVEVDDATIQVEARSPVIELLAPVGDRERMLMLAEKAVELGASAWRPIIYERSRSVSPRGEGTAFREKLRLRMISALEQSGGAWLPTLHAESSAEAAITSLAGSNGLLLDPAGAPLVGLCRALDGPCAIALGPEGGLTPAERGGFAAAEWRLASLGSNILRFETAGIAALALLRAHLREVI